MLVIVLGWVSRRRIDGLMAGATALLSRYLNPRVDRGDPVQSLKLLGAQLHFSSVPEPRPDEAPWSNRWAASQIPTPSCTSTFIRLASRMVSRSGPLRKPAYKPGAAVGIGGWPFCGQHLLP
mgnify:CR=1 FL=1